MKKLIEIIQGHKTLKFVEVKIQPADTHEKWVWEQEYTDQKTMKAIAGICNESNRTYRGYYRGKKFTQFEVDEEEIATAILGIQ